MEVVFLLAFVIPQSDMTAVYRAFGTAIGGMLALLIYLVWPTWEHPYVPGNIADRFEAIGIADNIAGSVLALEAYLVDNPSHCALPMVIDFCTGVDEALRIISEAIRERQPLTGFPNLQETLRRLQDRKSGHLAQDRCRIDLRFVIAEARRIVASMNGVRELLGGGYGSYKYRFIGKEG